MIQGIFASNQGIVGERVGDFNSAMLQIDPTGSALFLALTAGMSKEDAGDTVFHWYEDSHVSGRTAIVSGAQTVTIVVADGSFYIPGTVLLVEETGEIVFVTATNGDTLTVTRGMAGTANTSVNNTMHVQSIGNAHEEASGMPVAVSQQGAPRLNYTQIFRNTWAVSGTAKAVKYFTGSRVAKNKKECAQYHAEDQERAFLWGKKHIGTINTKQFRLTDGVVAQIEAYGGLVQSAASGGTPGDLNLTDFNEFLRLLFAYNVKGQPNERIVLAGDSVLVALQAMVLADSTYNITQGETTVGINVNTIVNPFGKLKMMTHPLMNESPFFRKQMYAMHPGGIKRKVLRDTFEEAYDRNGLRIQGKDADEGCITTEAGIAVGGASTMGIMRNINRGVASNP